MDVEVIECTYLDIAGLRTVIDAPEHHARRVAGCWRSAMCAHELAAAEVRADRSLAASPDRSDAVVQAHGATPGQVTLAWVLKRRQVMLPIPSTSKVTHLEENVGAAAVALSDHEFRCST